MAELTVEKGSKAIELARCSMESYVANGKRERPGCMKDVFYDRLGASVKLRSTRGRQRVRGSGVSYKRDKHLSEAIVDAVIEASSEESGTDELSKCELDKVGVTLCILDSIERVEDPAEELSLGRHGVIVEGGRNSSWLMPTVPLEHGWSVEETLDRTSCKARLDRGAWRTTDVDVYTFEAQIFQEAEPAGEVEEVELAAKA